MGKTKPTSIRRTIPEKMSKGYGSQSRKKNKTNEHNESIAKSNGMRKDMTETKDIMAPDQGIIFRGGPLGQRPPRGNSDTAKH